MARTVTLITKREAALRQLDQAIWLFFQRGDMLAVHTLAAASLQLFTDIAKKEGVVSRMEEAVERRIRPEHRKEWVAAVSRTRNFLKHADRDADQSHEYAEEETLFVLFEGTELAYKLGPKKSRECSAYSYWFAYRFPHLLEPEFAKQLQQMAATHGVDPTDRALWHRWLSEVQRGVKAVEQHGAYRRPDSSLENQTPAEFAEAFCTTTSSFTPNPGLSSRVA
jgi:hypothetical protein